ncbi:MAG: NAD-dependent DNA ligase LigA [Bacteroidales bacterium]|nr:NAD-dependent DNA ligase LigA [Bacteroidales bacterium]MDD3272708.1 NAD-dependent DNA ligase LigA [Bacteroidales bacterium]
MKKTVLEATKKIKWLREEILKHNRSYYIDNQPTISDFSYDLLLNELQTLEKKFPELADINSPTVRVGSDITSENHQNAFVQRLHKSPMLSLSNTYDKGELYAFNERIIKHTNDSINYVCELKIDGSAISLTYRNGTLIHAVTRGDGEKGDDVTRNVIKIKSLPKRLKGEGFPEEFEIRGEIFMPWSDFERLNKLREENDEPLFANPRNAAAGSLKLLDSSEAEERGLDIILYHLSFESSDIKTHYDALQAAASWGLPISNHTRRCSSINEVIDFLNYWDINRKSLPYPTDGAVIKIDSLNLQKELGYTAKSPRWATAYKFKAEKAITKILSVDYQVGRTGAITPVANLEPVLLSGTKVKRASLHNEDQIKALDIHIGDFVYVEKGGEIIPKITSVDKSRREINATIPSFPTLCPDCNTPLVKEVDEAKHYCPNIQGCPTQIKGRLIHFCSRKAMNINAGEATIEMLFNDGLLNNVADFYKLTTEDLIKFEGWREKSTDKFLKSVEASKKIPFYRVLYALGIRYVGETSAKSIANFFKNFSLISQASIDELIDIEDVGEVVAKSIYNFFRKPINIKLIDELRDAGISMESDINKKNVKSDALLGRTIVISGNFSITRDEMKEVIDQHSGKNSSSISSKTSFLISGTEAGPAKLEKAKKLGIEIITEEEFFKLIENK